MVVVEVVVVVVVVVAVSPVVGVSTCRQRFPVNALRRDRVSVFVLVSEGTECGGACGG